MRDDIGRGHGLLGKVGCGAIASGGMEGYAEEGCRLGIIALGEETEDDTREDVARACCRHAAVARGVEDSSAVGEGCHGEGPLEDDHDLMAYGEEARGIDTLYGLLMWLRQSVELAGMWGQDDSRRKLETSVEEGAEGVKTIGIDDHRDTPSVGLNDGTEKLSGGDVTPKTRTYAYGCDAVDVHALIPQDDVVAVGMGCEGHGLGDCGLEGDVALSGRGGREKPSTAAEGGARRKNCRTRHAFGACEEEGVTHRPLMGEAVAVADKCCRLGIVGVEHEGRGLGYGTRVELDVENVPLAYITGELGEEERHLGELEGDGVGGTDYLATRGLEVAVFIAQT